MKSTQASLRLCRTLAMIKSLALFGCAAFLENTTQYESSTHQNLAAIQFADLVRSATSYEGTWTFTPVDDWEADYEAFLNAGTWILYLLLNFPNIDASHPYYTMISIGFRRATRLLFYPSDWNRQADFLDWIEDPESWM